MAVERLSDDSNDTGIIRASLKVTVRSPMKERLMHIDLTRANFFDYATDVCVVGAGVAGITLARRLLAAGRTVTLLESGGLDYEADTASLNVGNNIGEPYYALDHARLRFFGGTTAIWGGRVAELDPVDFEKRSWVPHSGWPISHDDIASYYGEARSLFDLPQRRPDRTMFNKAGSNLPDFDDAQISYRFWSFDRKFNRFSFEACEDLIRHPRCTVMTYANVTQINSDAGGRRITSVELRNLSGFHATLHARVFVLAAGGIENPRLLLASRGAHPLGLGNQHDLVGRFFMEHPHARGGRVMTNRLWSLLEGFGKARQLPDQLAAALITPSLQVQEREGTLNTSLTIAARQPVDHRQFAGVRAYSRVKHDLEPTRGARRLWLGTKRAIGIAQKIVDPARPWLLHKLGRVELALLVRGEQAPNPDSRVTLSNERDALGVPGICLDWRTNDLDVHSVERLVHALGSEMRRLGLGEVAPADWLSGPDRRWTTDPLISAHPIGGYHHMGTTRMAYDPRQGVVDEHCRVHGIDNLYVAGSSVFPTSGWANPTFTIAALALRTADHIASRAESDKVRTSVPRQANSY